MSTDLRQGAQWLSGRVLDSRPRGHGFEPHRPYCVVVLEQDTFIYPNLVLVQPRKTCPCLTERLLMGHKESNQTKQTDLRQEGHSGPESLTCTMCTSLVQWKVKIKTIWSRPSGFRLEDFFLFSLYNAICYIKRDPRGGTIFDKLKFSRTKVKFKEFSRSVQTCFQSCWHINV